MVFVKYVLSKTGLFPQWQPQVSDILEVVLDAYEIKRIRTPRGGHYFYVIPAFSNNLVNAKMLRKFRANGIILRPHYSRNYNMLVYRVRDKNQQFMLDATEVSRDASKFQEIMEQRLKERENKKYVLRELFGKYEK